ncbi:MAG: tyrosine-type recombinase/integrase [Terriglobales bacterium]
MPTADLRALPFFSAATAWLESRRSYISASTHRDYTIYIRTLAKYFSDFYLNEISADQIRTFQHVRMAEVQWSSINKETSVLQQMLKRIGHWPAIAHDFQPLPPPKNADEIGRCITDEEETRFFRIALDRPAWCVAAWASLLSVNTTAGPGEMLHLRIADLDLDNKKTIRISPEGAKNRTVRVRNIPLNDSALWAARMFLARARHECQCLAPEHYLIPFHETARIYNPHRPQASYYKAFNAILARAKLKFRPYDFRHTAITRLLEDPDVPLEVARAISGHIISDRMIRRYFHGRLSAQRSAIVFGAFA